MIPLTGSDNGQTSALGWKHASCESSLAFEGFPELYYSIGFFPSSCERILAGGVQEAHRKHRRDPADGYRLRQIYAIGRETATAGGRLYGGIPRRYSVESMSATCRVLWKPTKWVRSCNDKSVDSSIARPKAYTRAPTDVIVKSNQIKSNQADGDPQPSSSIYTGTHLCR